MMGQTNFMDVWCQIVNKQRTTGVQISFDYVIQYLIVFLAFFQMNHDIMTSMVLKHVNITMEQTNLLIFW